MKQEDFIPGRWYRSTAEANNRGGEIYYGKFLEFRNDAFVASSARVSGSIIDLKYTFNSGYIWELVTDLTEIQHLLPTNHPDKIMKPAPEAIMEVFGKFIIGNIVVSLRTNLPWREEGDMFTILPNSKQDMLYYKPSTHSQDRDDWRLATTKECHAYHNGVKNIKQMDSPKAEIKPHDQPTKEASKEELLAYCKKMYPIGTVIQGGNVVTKELVWESSAFISHHGLGIVYNQKDHTFANILSFRDVQEPTKTLKDLPKKATLSDVSALVKHQEPVIAFSKKAKRSKLIIINK